MPAVGKTSLVRRFVHSTFDERYLSTIGTGISMREVEIERGGTANIVKLILWDLSGAENYSSLTETYFRGLSGAMLVCDLTRRSTLESMRSHIAMVREINAEASIILLCNKSDQDYERKISVEQIESFGSSFGIEYYLTSAKSGHNVDLAFTSLAKMVHPR